VIQKRRHARNVQIEVNAKHISKTQVTPLQSEELLNYETSAASLAERFVFKSRNIHHETTAVTGLAPPKREMVGKTANERMQMRTYRYHFVRLSPSEFFV
jgi:hypothetical protein